MKLIDSMIEAANIATEAGNLEYISRLTSVLLDTIAEEIEDCGRATVLVAAALGEANDRMHEEGY